MASILRASWRDSRYEAHMRNLLQIPQIRTVRRLTLASVVIVGASLVVACAPPIVNANFSGTVDPTGPVLEDGSAFSVHRFEAKRGDRVVVAARSDEMDVYIFVVGPDGETLAQDDDGGEGPNAYAEFEAPVTGGYAVVVNSYRPAVGGDYDLDVQTWR